VFGCELRRGDVAQRRVRTTVVVVVLPPAADLLRLAQVHERFLAQRKLAGMKRLEPAVRKRRLYGQLARRGFTPDTIHSAFDALADRLFED